MRTRHTMTLLLVMTLLTNLAHHERGSVTASGEVEKSELTSKRRILERLIRRRLASSDRHSGHSQSTSQQHLYPATAPDVSNVAGKTPRPLSSSFLQWFHSNHIPTDSNWGQEKEPPPDVFQNFNSSVLQEMTNLFLPSADEDRAPNELPLRVKQTWFEEDSDERRLHRRNAGADAEGGGKKRSSSKERKRKQKQERKDRRNGKKNKRNKEKERRKKENKRLQEILANDDVVLHTIDGEDYLDCCPSKLIVVEKKVGKDRTNHAVDVRPSQKYFYERVCLPGIEERECVFPARSLRKGVVTRCAQHYSYVQAQVRPFRKEIDWHLDYIYVRSGCSCQVSVSPKKKKKNGN